MYYTSVFMCVSHTKGGSHCVTPGLPIPIEIGLFAVSFDCPSADDKSYTRVDELAIIHRKLIPDVPFLFYIVQTVRYII